MGFVRVEDDHNPTESVSRTNRSAGNLSMATNFGLCTFRYKFIESIFGTSTMQLALFSSRKLNTQLKVINSLRRGLASLRLTCGGMNGLLCEHSLQTYATKDRLASLPQ